MTFATAFVLAASVAGLLIALRTSAAIRRLPPLPPIRAGERERLPSATIVAAARNEARGIEAAVRSWLAQDCAVTVVVVDDRSTDETPAILARLAASEPRITVVRVDERPDGWLGKCNALQQGARAARGDFLLFTDADVLLEPDALPRALAACEREGADYLTLVPWLDTDGILQWSLTASFFQLFLLVMRADLARSDDRRCLIGVGAFNLVRRSAYERVGGHEEIRMQVGDDVALSRLLARAGARRRFHLGLDVARVHWQHGGALATIRGIEKNTFWAARLSVGLMLALTAGVLALLSPLLGPFLGGWGWAAFALYWTGAALPHLAAPQARTLAAAGTLLSPVAALLLLAAGWNSMIVTLRQGGIRWRDDFFTLAELRATQKPLSWWGFGPGRP